MKKTLALALIAAMTISMASMTAFASVHYNADDATKLEELEATVTMTGAEIAAAAPDKYFFNEKTEKLYASQLKSDGTYEAKDDTEVTAPKLTPAQMGVNDKRATKLNTATKTFVAWGKKGGSTVGENKTGDKDVALTQSGKNYTVTLATAYNTTKDDEQIAKNLKAIEDAKKEEDKEKGETDKLQKFDEKYGANIKDDNTNGFDENTGKAIDITAKADRVKKGEDGKSGMSDFYAHAINIAGAPDDDGKKTWTYDVIKTAGKLGDGNTVRVEFDLGIEGDTDLSRFEWKVYHIVGWCKAEKVKKVEVVGNKLYAWVDSCSPFVVTRGDVNGASTGAKDASNPSTGDFSAVPVALLAAAALGATGFVAYKKRKAE